MGVPGKCQSDRSQVIGRKLLDADLMGSPGPGISDKKKTSKTATRRMSRKGQKAEKGYGHHLLSVC